MISDALQLRTYTRALASRTRLRVLRLVAERGELSVAELSRLVGLSRPLASWHLRRLQRAGLVRQRRQGRKMHYSLDGPRLLARQSELNNHMEQLVASANGADIAATAPSISKSPENRQRG